MSKDQAFSDVALNLPTIGTMVEVVWATDCFVFMVFVVPTVGVSMVEVCGTWLTFGWTLAFPVNGLTCRVFGGTICVAGLTVSVDGVIGSVEVPLTFDVDGGIVKTERVAVPVTSVVEGVMVVEESVLAPSTDAVDGMTV